MIETKQAENDLIRLISQTLYLYLMIYHEVSQLWLKTISSSSFFNPAGVVSEQAS